MNKETKNQINQTFVFINTLQRNAVLCEYKFERVELTYALKKTEQKLVEKRTSCHTKKIMFYIETTPW